MSTSSQGASASPAEVKHRFIDYAALLQPMLEAIEHNAVGPIKGTLLDASLKTRIPTSRLFLERYTATIGGPRQTGKTSAIVKLSCKDDLIVVENQGYESHIRELVAHKGDDRPRIVTAAELKYWIKSAKQLPDLRHLPQGHVKGMLPKAPARVYVDNASFFTQRQLEIRDIAWWCAQHTPIPTLVLVG